MGAEKKFRNTCEKFESIVKKNSNCRKKRDLVSCMCCKDWDSCKANNYNDLLLKKRELSKRVLGAWEIEKEIRKKYQ